MLDAREIEGTNIIELEVDGKVPEDRLREVIEFCEDAIERHGTVRFLEIVRSFEGMDAARAWWEDARFTLRHVGDVERAAVVADQQWIRLWAKLCKPATSFPVRTFEPEEIVEARAWVREGL